MVVQECLSLLLRDTYSFVYEKVKKTLPVNLSIVQCNAM